MASEQKGGGGPGVEIPEQGEWFDLLPVEKKLIAWSLGLGAVLLALLVWMSYYVIPVPH